MHMGPGIIILVNKLSVDLLLFCTVTARIMKH